MRRLCVLALMSAGCANLFGLVDVQDVPDDAGVDGAITDGGFDAMHDAAIDSGVPATACPADYALVGGQRVKLHMTIASWTAAQQTCLNERGTSTNYTHLVVIASESERSVVGAYAGSMNFWLGLTDRIQANQWIWVTDETATYPGTNAWATGEPSVGAYNCAIQLGNDDFTTTDCSFSLGFMCECDAVPTDLTNY